MVPLGGMPFGAPVAPVGGAFPPFGAPLGMPGMIPPHPPIGMGPGAFPINPALGALEHQIKK